MMLKDTLQRFTDVFILFAVAVFFIVVFAVAGLILPPDVFAQLLPIFVVVTFLTSPILFIWLTSYVDKKWTPINREGLCLECEYDLRGSIIQGEPQVTCPECGCVQPSVLRRDDSLSGQD